MTVRSNICHLFCSKKIVKICWRRKHSEPCKLYRCYIEQIKYEKYRELEDKQKRDTMKNIINSDKFDSNAYNVDDKSIEESLYDEQMDVMLE